MSISKSLKDNIAHIEKIFDKCGDVVKRELPIGLKNQFHIYIVYIDLLIDTNVIDEQIIYSLKTNESYLFDKNNAVKENLLDSVKNIGIDKFDVSEESDMSQVEFGILCGDTAIFIDGEEKVILASSKSFPNRGVQNADSEVVVQGAKESFSEVFRINTALIRRRIRDTNLKIEQVLIGRKSKTNVAIIYLDDLVRKNILQEVLDRIDNIDIDAIFDIGYIEQLIEDNFFSPFPQGQITERPDKAASAVLEGRIGIIVDNSPYVLLVPSTLNVFFQSSEDYYQRWEIASFTRILRFIGGFLAIALPGIYIATSTYHPSMIPMELLFRMSKARKDIPFPAIFEIIMMELIFELLREAGIRLPKAVGTTLGIVGGLIIGQTAVEVGIVSPTVVIIISITAIAGFAIPNYSLVAGFRLVKYFTLICSSLLGILGFWLSLIIVILHLVSLKSFGLPYMYPFVSGHINEYKDLQDTIIRPPIFKLKFRPIFANPKNIKRIDNEKFENRRNKLKKE